MTPRIAGQDRRDKYIDFRGHPEDVARVKTAAATHDITPSQWVEDVIADALEDATGWRDEARRNAPRRPNRQPRQDRRTDRNRSRLAARVSGEEKTRIADLARTLGTTVTEWAWGVLGEALEKEGWQS